MGIIRLTGRPGWEIHPMSENGLQLAWPSVLRHIPGWAGATINLICWILMDDPQWFGDEQKCAPPQTLGSFHSYPSPVSMDRATSAGDEQWWQRWPSWPHRWCRSGFLRCVRLSMCSVVAALWVPVRRRWAAAWVTTPMNWSGRFSESE
jgi:hypothetical protein